MAAVAAAAAALLLGALAPTRAHVALRYPPARLQNDFLDNARTTDICGEKASTVENAYLWQLSEPDNTTVTQFAAGQPATVSWDLHYAHNGGFAFELYSADMTLIHRWNESRYWQTDASCAVDGTIQNTTLTMPSEPCAGCTLRLLREAKEWGDSYKFKSCAMVDIVPAAAAGACNGCSGRGECQQGACQCVSTPADGFFYGAHCEYENECETNAHCGANGRCVDVGDTAGPAKQCFCRAGFFGDVEASATGLERRVCDRASQLALDVNALDSFGEGYERSELSTDTFEMFWTVSGDSIEVAVKAMTTSWLGVGWRSVDTEAETAAADGGAAAEGAASEGAPAEGSTAESAPAEGSTAESAPAEGSTPVSKQKDGAAAEAAPAEPAPSAEKAPAAEGEGYRRRRLHAHARALAEREDLEEDKAPEVESEKAPAAEGEGAATTEAAQAEGSAAEGAPAEGEAAGGGGACPVITDVAQVVKPFNLGVGEAVTAAQAALAAQSEAPAAEGEGAPAEGEGAPATAEGAASRRRLASRMPALEAEASAAAATTLRRASRRLLQAAAEGEGAAPAEGEGAAPAEGEGAGTAKAGAIKRVASGPCAGYFQTPGASHAMANQDIVLGKARAIGGEQFFKAEDMFTPSRAKPKPDHEFCDGSGACGTDDIDDAIGVEVGGATYLKFRRALKTADASASDACLSEDQAFAVVYAYGQVAPDLTHEPASSLENIPQAARTAPDFYKPDELKFHGGGIGTSFAGRGQLGNGQTNFFVAPEAGGGACEASELDGFACQREYSAAGVFLHWNPPDASSARLAVEKRGGSGGWLALAFADDINDMTSAVAVIADGDTVTVNDLTSRDLGGVTGGQREGAVASGGGRRLRQDTFVTEASVTRTGGSAVLAFTKPFDDTFSGSGEQGYMVAQGDGALAYHNNQREGFTLDIASGAGGSTGTPDVVKWRRAHAWLMVLGWGVFIPLGIASSLALRSCGGIWFQIHRGINALGLLLATAGVIIAWAQFVGLPDDHKRHEVLGVLVMVLGWLQPLNALLRPHAPNRKEGEAKSTLRLAWEVAHKSLGYVTTLCAIINIFFGFQVGALFQVFDAAGDNVGAWRGAYIGVLVAIVAFALFGFVCTLFKAKKSPPAGKHVDSPAMGSDEELQGLLRRKSADAAHV